MKRASPETAAHAVGNTTEVCILAGGLSTRMGRDKAHIHLNGRTLLSHVRTTARNLGHPVRVIRRDLVERCGPLGGVFTGLKSSRANAVLFLACDMPFVSVELLRGLLKRLSSRQRAVFATLDDVAGFPFVVRPSALEVVEGQISRKQFSIQKLATALEGRRWAVPRSRRGELRNLNTPDDLRAVR